MQSQTDHVILQVTARRGSRSAAAGVNMEKSCKTRVKYLVLIKHCMEAEGSGGWLSLKTVRAVEDSPDTAYHMQIFY